MVALVLLCLGLNGLTVWSHHRTVTYFEVTFAAQEVMEKPSQVLLSTAGTSYGSGPDDEVATPTINPIAPELQSKLLTPGMAGFQPEAGLRGDRAVVHRLTGAVFEGSDPQSLSSGFHYPKLVSVVLTCIAAETGIHPEGGLNNTLPLLLR